MDLCPGLQNNKSLTKLIIADNDISDSSSEDEEGLKKFAGVLLVHPTLTSVDLLYNR